METPGFIDSKFRLAILAAKRAKQLVRGAKRKTDINAENPLTVALDEIQRGKISFQIFEEEDFKTSPINTSNDEEDILEALGNVESDDDYEEVDPLEEAEDEEEDDYEEDEHEDEEEDDYEEDDYEEEQEDDD